MTTSLNTSASSATTFLALTPAGAARIAHDIVYYFPTPRDSVAVVLYLDQRGLECACTQLYVALDAHGSVERRPLSLRAEDNPPPRDLLRFITASGVRLDVHVYHSFDLIPMGALARVLVYPDDGVAYKYVCESRIHTPLDLECHLRETAAGRAAICEEAACGSDCEYARTSAPQQTEAESKAGGDNLDYVRTSLAEPAAPAAPAASLGKCRIDVTPRSTFDELVALSADQAMGHVTHADVAAWYTDCPPVFTLPGMGSRFDMAIELQNSKLAGFGTFLADVAAVVHLVVMLAIDAKTAVSAAEMEDVPIREWLVDPAVQRQRPVYAASGVTLFNVALQLEMLFANVAGAQAHVEPFKERVVGWRDGAGTSVFEIELLYALADALRTFTVVGEGKKRVVAVKTETEQHWLPMQRLLAAKEGDFLHTLLASKWLAFCPKQTGTAAHTSAAGEN